MAVETEISPVRTQAPETVDTGPRVRLACAGRCGGRSGGGS